MQQDPGGAVFLIRQSGQVERLDRPEPMLAAPSYADALRLGRRGEDALTRERRGPQRMSGQVWRGRLLDLVS